MNKIDWKVIDGEVYLFCGSKKIAKMIPDEIGQEEMINLTSTIKTTFNDFFERKNNLTQLTETI